MSLHLFQIYYRVREIKLLFVKNNGGFNNKRVDVNLRIYFLKDLLFYTYDNKCSNCYYESFNVIIAGDFCKSNAIKFKASVYLVIKGISYALTPV